MVTVDLRLGDCLEILPTLPKVDAVITDPPYGVGFGYKSGVEETDNPSDYWEWLRPIYLECLQLLKPGGLIAIWNAHKNFRHFWDWFGDDIVIYAAAKNFVQLRNTPFQLNGYDPVVMKYLPGVPLRPSRPKRSLNFFVANTAGIVADTTRIEKAHPCPRPLDAVREIVDNFSLPGGTILDPFMGSGTTGVACVQLNRNFIGIEIDLTYYAIAEKRIREAQMQIPMELKV